MYTVLIAEDELLVRMGIASAVPWAQMNMRVVAETADGETAWNAFRQYKPDIIITDIRMPRINGLELIRKIRQEDAECAIIVVTNVEHEETLEKARELGIAGFLLKATMRQNDIADMVLKVRDTLPEGRGSHAALTDNFDLWREFLTSVSMTPEDLSLRCEQENAAFFQPEGFVFLHILNNERLSHRLANSLISSFAHRLGLENSFCVIDMGNDAIALSRKSFSPQPMMRNLSDLAQYVRNHFDSELCFVMWPYPSKTGDLRARMATARRYTKHTFFFDEPTLLLDNSGRPDFEKLNKAVKALDYCKILSPQMYGGLKCADLIASLPQALLNDWQLGMSLGAQILSEFGAPQVFSGVHSMIGAVTQEVEQAIRHMKVFQHPSILAAIEYMEEHISDKLTIRQVSERVGYHPVYFSNLFKQEAGLSYSDFLTALRIQYAKELLKSGNTPLHEIADQCGFADLAYFSNKFKRVTGMSPSQWRSKR